MQQILRGTSNTITATFLDGEDPVSVTGVTVTVTDSAGAVLVTAQSTTGADDAWSYLLPSVDECDQLTAVWTGTGPSSSTRHTTEEIEVVGGYLFTLARLKSFPDIAGDDTYNGAYVFAREKVESLVERTCGTPFVEKFKRETHRAGRRVRLYENYPRRIIWVKANGVATSLDDVVLRHDLVCGPFHCNDEIEVGYVHGYSYNGAVPQAPPDLSDAAALAARYGLLGTEGQSGIPQRARGITNQSGTSFSLSTAGPNHPTGYDDLDEVICGWRDRVRIPAIA